MVVRYHLSNGDVVDHRADDATMSEIDEFHDQVFRDLGDDSRLTLNTDNGKRVIRVRVIDWYEIDTEGGG